MILKFSFDFNYFYTNLLVFTICSFISTIANDVQKCTIGELDDCPQSHSCIQTEISGSDGRCVCVRGCPSNQTVVSNVESLPIYSNDNNSNSSSVIITSIFGSVIALSIMFSAYYFGIRKGLFHEVWVRTFTPRQVEHQLLDRSPSNEDNNDSEAIA